MIDQAFVDFLRVGDTVEVTYETGAVLTGKVSTNSLGDKCVPTSNNNKNHITLKTGIVRLKAVKVLGRTDWREGDLATGPGWSKSHKVTRIDGWVYIDAQPSVYEPYNPAFLIPVFAEPIVAGSIVETNGLTGEVVKVHSDSCLIEYGDQTRSWTPTKYLKSL